MRGVSPDAQKAFEANIAHDEYGTLETSFSTGFSSSLIPSDEHDPPTWLGQQIGFEAR